MPIANPRIIRTGRVPAALISILIVAAVTSCSTPLPTAPPEATGVPATQAPTPAAPTHRGLPEVQTDIPSLHEVFARDFLVGAALPSDQLSMKDNVALLTRHFNSITLENEMKPGLIQPREGEFRWTGPDKAVKFAREHGIAVHGHTLVWHLQGAGWMFIDQDRRPLPLTPESKALVLGRMEDHIRAVVGRYRDDVNVWDVVNEVIDPAEPDCLRRSDWYKYAGPEYIAEAFRIAHEAAPEAALIINDIYTTEPAKRECLYRVVRDLLAQGVPVSGVGHQMHINIESPSAAEIEETILRFAELGIPQHITELDISIYPNDTDSYKTVPEEVLIRQGYRYKEVFDVFRRQAANIDTVTFWGMADDHTWLTSWPIVRINLPMPFDELLQAKPAYWGMVDPSKLPALIQNPDPMATVEPAALISAMPGAPVIDGNPDAVWSTAGEISTGVWVVGTSGSTAKVRTLWDSSHLYIYAEVTDAKLSKAAANPWEQDSIEVYLDQNNAKSAGYQADDCQYRINFDNQQSFNGGAKAERITSATKIVPGGYVVELAIALDAVVPAEGVRIGFDIQVNNDEDGDGVRDSVAIWHDPSGESYQNTSGWGVLEFRKPD